MCRSDKPGGERSASSPQLAYRLTDDDAWIRRRNAKPPSITYLLFIKSSLGRTVPGHAPRSAKAEEDSG
jgi:hypothetical protein